MITNQIKLTENYWLYAKVFGLDVLKTQLHLIESTQGTYRTTNPLRTRNLVVVGGQLSAPRRSTVIRLSIPSRRSTRLTPPTPIPTTDEADDMILQDIIQLSLAEQKSHKEYEARENADSSTLRNGDNPNDLGTRLEPRSDKESPEVVITTVVQLVNINNKEEESAKDDYELKRRENTNSYATDDDDVLSNEKVPQELMDDMSQTVDEAKLCKVINEMLRQQCTSEDEHKYHIDQMQNFSKSDIVWESIKDIIVLLYQPKHTSVVQSRQRDPKAYALTMVKQDLLYLKKGNTRSEKIALSLYKFLAVRFLDNDIEERTSKWVMKCIN
nr:hypothetical protein [Tanacetum cinerariifolium]